MASSCLLNIYAYDHGQMLLFALVREASLHSIWQLMQIHSCSRCQDLMTAVYSSPNKAFIPPHLGVREGLRLGSREKCTSWVTKRGVANHSILGMTPSLQSWTHSSWGCLHWACIRLGLSTVSHGGKSSSLGPSPPCELLTIYGSWENHCL